MGIISKARNTKWKKKKSYHKLKENKPPVVNTQCVVYTYFKKRCQRERRMADVQRKLHDRKELWFHIWFAKTMSSSRGAKQGTLSNHDDDGNKKPTNLHI